MPISDPTDILLAHDQWATQNILNACVPLTDQQFHRRFDMGPGSLHDTTTHILAAMRGWADLLATRDFQPRLEGTRRTIPELLSLLNEVAADFTHHAKAHPPEGLVTRERGGKSHTFPRGGVIVHVTTHGMHHRAQCLNMLRQLGVELPMSSVMQWMVTAGAGL